MKPPKPEEKKDPINVIEGISEKIEETFDEMYSNAQASKNIR